VREKGYYSTRTGKHPDGGSLDLPSIKRLFAKVYEQMCEAGFCQEAFGYDCVDAGFVAGSLGNDVAGAMLVALRRGGLWPIPEQVEGYSEEDLFDVIEFLFDHVSQGVDGFFHSNSECGMHFSEFNQREGQRELRNRLNPLLGIYGAGFTLSDDGEVLHVADRGLSPCA
jgi:hypothetical protein